MLLHDIEEALRGLSKRKKVTSEEELVYYLESAGWDGGAIKDAVLIFRASGGVVASQELEDNHLLREEKERPALAIATKEEECGSHITQQDDIIYDEETTRDGPLFLIISILVLVLILLFGYMYTHGRLS